MKKYLMPLVLIFILTNALFLSFQKRLVEKGFDTDALIIGNVVLFAAGLLSFLIVQKGITGESNAAFVRRVYGGFVGKLMVILAGVVVYIMIGHVNKPSLFVLLGLYLVYTTVEVTALMKLNSAQKNA